MLSRIPFLENAIKNCFQELTYTLREKFLLEGEYLAHARDEADKLVFIEKGIVEVVTEMEGNEFVMERLGPGSILFINSFLLED